MGKRVMRKEIIVASGAGLGAILGFFFHDIAGGIILGMAAVALPMAALRIWGKHA